MHEPHHRLPILVAALVAGSLVLAGCGSAGTDDAPRPAGAAPATSSGGAASAPPDAPPPSPGSVLDAPPEDWRGTSVPAGLTLAVVVGAADEPGVPEALAAVRAYAAEHAATVTVVESPSEAASLGWLADVVAGRPDLVVGVGAGLVEPIDLVSAANLQQSFLLLGAQLAEPTANVTAVIWDGADASGVETGQGGDAQAAAGAALAARAADAIAAGVAAFVRDESGYVWRLPA